MRKLTILVLLGSLVFGAPLLAAGGKVTPLANDMSKDDRMAAKAAEAASAKAFTGKLPSGVRTNAPAPMAANPNRATMGTITYDDGVFNSLPVQPAGITDIMSFGNQFNTVNLGPIPAPTITVTQLTIWPALIDGSSTASGAGFITLFGPVNTAGTNASPISSNNYAGLMPSTWNTFAIANTGTVSPAAGPGTRSSFLVGMFGPAAGGPGTPCTGDCIGFSTGTVGGQGFHAMHIDDFSGGDFGTIPGFNAMIRVSGNVVPVELMGFTIE